MTFAPSTLSQDEKNSLVDLCSECEKALVQAEEGLLNSALQTSQKLLESCGLERLVVQEEEEEGEERGKEAAKAAEISQLQIRMMEVEGELGC